MDSFSQKASKELVSKLKESVDNQVQLLQTARHRRSVALEILKAAVFFLQSWDKLDASNFPNEVVRNAFHVCLAELGPGDAKVRTTLLETISSLERSDTRQAVLDAMPWTMPADPKELEEATKQVLDTLKEVLLEDAEALLPVLECLSLLPLSQKGRAQAWHVALASLPIVSEANLPVLAKTLLCDLTNGQDALRALEALRTEFELLQSVNIEEDDDKNEEDNDVIPLLAHVLFSAFRDHENGLLITKAYLDILNGIFTEQEGDADDVSEDEEATTFLLLDAVAVLALYQNSDAKSDIENMMDTWIASNSFPFSSFLALLNELRQPLASKEVIPDLLSRLVPSLLSLAVFLLLAPVRLGTFGDERNDVRQFVLELYQGLDGDYQEELVQCLLHLGEETSRDRQDVDADAKRRVRKFFGTLTKREGLKVTADIVYSLLKQLAGTAKSSVARFKHILVERLTSVTNDATLDDHQSTQDVCAILTCLIEPSAEESGGGDGIDASEMMILLQKLLFTTSFSLDRRTRGESTLDVGRVLRGLILATELVKSEALSRSVKECIHQWVHRILLPSTRRTVDPEIGSLGLKFLSAWLKWRQSAFTDTVMARPSGKEKIYDQFQSFKMILANTGLIQMRSLYLERRKRPNQTVLGYSTIPSPFLTYSDPSGKSSKRDMVFCVHSYVKTSNVQDPSRWGQMTTWVYNLVDTYLTMGREGTKGNSRTKWLPDGWLEASLELPRLNLVVTKTAKKRRTATELLSRQLCNHELSFTSSIVSKSVCSEVSNGLSEDKDIDEMNAQVESVLRMILSFLLGIGLSAAVLRNTYAHLQSFDDAQGDLNSIPQEQDSRRHHELAKLMQYQVMKLYDMKRKTETSVRFLETLGSTIRRAYLRGKTANGGRSRGRRRNVDAGETVEKASRIASTVDATCEQTRQALSQIFCSSNFVEADILMRCLVDSADETVLVEGLKPSSSSTPLHLKMIMELRKSLLDHLSLLYQGSGIHDATFDDSAVTSIASLLKTASTISRMLPAFRKAMGSRKPEQELEESLDSDEDEVDAISTLDVSALSSAYFRMVKLILVKATEELSGEKSLLSEETGRNGEVLSSHASLMDMIVQSCTVESSDTDPSGAAKPAAPSVSVVFDSFLHHLRICEDEATALELVDILSILSSNNEALTQRAVEACWRVLHTVYTVWNRNLVESSGGTLPRAFYDALDSLTNDQLVDKVLSETIVKTATVDAKNTQGDGVLRHSVSLLWSLTAQLPPRSGFEYWCKMTTELVQFLDAIDGSPSEDESSRQQETTDARSQRLERRGKRPRPRPHMCSIPNLTLASFGTFFELVLHATVATFAISPPACTDSSGERASPFQHHRDMVQLFGRLLDIFVTHFHLFPKRMLSVVLASCKQMLSVCTFQVDSCVQWRNGQPILTVQEKRAGVHDYGSIKFLDRLLQVFASQGAGKVIATCQSIRRLASAPGDSDEDEAGDDLFTNLAKNDKRFTSLMLSAQKTMDSLRNVSTAHNLVPPQLDRKTIDGLSRQETVKKATAVGDADKGYHELDLTKETHTENEAEKVSEKRKRRRVVPTLVSTQVTGSSPKQADASNPDTGSPKARKARHPVIAEEGDDDDDCIDVKDVESPKLSDGFGVSGKWCGDDDEDDDESSSGSLELEMSNGIFQAT